MLLKEMYPSPSAWKTFARAARVARAFARGLVRGSVRVRLKIALEI